jgi:hypothetical protein
MTTKTWCDRCGKEIPDDEPEINQRTDGRFVVRLSLIYDGDKWPDICQPCRLDIWTNGTPYEAKKENESP